MPSSLRRTTFRFKITPEKGGTKTVDGAEFGGVLD